MRFRCGNCGDTIRVDGAEPGEALQCPNCAHEIRVPDAEGQTAALTPEALSHTEEREGFAVQARQAMARRVAVTCGGCGRTLKISGRMAGKKARCPSCMNLIRIPHTDDDELVALITRKEEGEEPEEVLEDLGDGEMGLAGDDFPPVPQGAAPPEQARHAAAGAMASAASTLRVDRSGRAAAPAAKNRSAIYWIGGGVLVVLFFGIGLMIGLEAMRGDGGGGPTGLPTGPAGPGPAAAQNPPAPRASDPPESKPAPKTQPEAPPAEPDIRLTVGKIETSIFGPGGYHPAGARNVYWFVPVKVEAMGRPAEFTAHGFGAYLATEAMEHPSLGVRPGEGGVPLLARPGTLRVPRGGSREVTLVFEVPRTETSASLVIPPYGSAALGGVSPPAAVEEEKILGRFREAPPRNLRPMLRHPVMAALQANPDPEVHIRREKDGMKVYMSWGVRGELESLGGGVFEADLTRGKEKLKTKLRLIDEGKRLVLYLSEEPFHQMTFERF